MYSHFQPSKEKKVDLNKDKPFLDYVFYMPIGSGWYHLALLSKLIGLQK